MPDPTTTFRELKRRVGIERVLACRGLLDRMQRRGDRLVGCCPIHRGDSHTAFVVNLSKNLWHCFTACGDGGDVVELVRRLDRCQYHDVARYLAALAHAAPPIFTSSLSPAPRCFMPFTRSVPLDHAFAWLQQKGIRTRTARAFEAGRYQGSGFLRGCVAVRLHDLEGAPLGYAGRRLHPEELRVWGKWKLPPAFPRNQTLYGFHRVRHLVAPLGIVLVECPWGVMRLAQLRVPAVALLGTYASDRQLHLLGLAPIVVLLMDGDTAGRKAAIRLKQQLDGRCRVEVASLPDGCDPDDLTDRQLLAAVTPLLGMRLDPID